MKFTTIRVLFIILQIVLVGQLYAIPITEISDLCNYEWIFFPAPPTEYSGRSALMEAVIDSNPEVIRELLEAGADVKARAQDGTTVLMSAAGNDNPEVFRLLLEAGVEVNARSKTSMTALIHAARFNQNPEVIRVLLEAGADVNARNKGGETALMLAAWYNKNPEVALALLEADADARIKDNEGKTAWDYAQDNSELKGTDAYQKLKDATYE